VGVGGVDPVDDGVETAGHMVDGAPGGPLVVTLPVCDRGRIMEIERGW
jgi:hypothetical protein